ncbi:hypothetical protein NDR87_16105 [Nocardia sp. CDC159]|uniref:Uncharacterized protein n=1 Tax=Nocardia pulmonis TaxID=2951408 RepID=A0A9X2E9H3_9NOCA|nr:MULTISPECIES: hypothetical protein [Nocardia]MCM6775383.1 hypothetical protein [Nocardia pulmonis]MCM6787883.1 hypothetical protein [Nocardia sp. CDC159]
MTAMMLYDTFGALFAQVGVPEEEPPSSERWLRLIRYLTWLVLLVPLVAAIAGAGVGLVLLVRRFSRGGRPDSDKPAN